MKLSDIKITTPLIKLFIDRLAKSTKQAIPIKEIGKVKRVNGASSVPVDMVLENGQKLTIYIRMIDEQPDLFRVDINGKQQPIAGDYDTSYKPSFNASVDLLANIIISGQDAFQKKLAKVKVRPPRTGDAPKNTAQQKNALLQKAKDLDEIIEDREKTKAELTNQLNSILNQA